jgi:hypothetical protein
MAEAVFPSNGSAPASASKRMTPSDQMSVLESTAAVERTCSGEA